MDTIFYSLGVMYFIVSFYNLYTYDHSRDVSISADSNISDIIEDAEKKDEKYIQKYYPRQTLGILFFIWTYIGCVGGFPEKPLFIFNLTVLIVNILILVTMGFLLGIKAFSSVLNFKPYSQENKKNKIPLTKIVYFLETITVGLIIGIHYLN